MRFAFDPLSWSFLGGSSAQPIPGAYPGSFVAVPAPAAPSTTPSTTPSTQNHRRAEPAPRPGAFQQLVEQQLPADEDDDEEDDLTTAHARARTIARRRARAEKRRAPRPRTSGTKQPRWSFVFVGNLDRFVTDRLLREHFKECGTVAGITIRCSRGVAVSALVRPKESSELNDRVYATVEFMSTKAATRALDLNGTRLDGRAYDIIVCSSPYDLPEGKRYDKPTPTVKIAAAPLRREGSRDMPQASKRHPVKYEGRRPLADKQPRLVDRQREQRRQREKIVEKQRHERLVSLLRLPSFPVTVA